MLDTSSSTWLKHEKIKDAAVAFVNQLRPDDRVMVISFANEITVEIAALARPCERVAVTFMNLLQRQKRQGFRFSREETK